MISERNGVRWIQPDWPAPDNVRAASTLRSGGVSVAPFDSLNLGLHVGDDSAAVHENRRRVMNVLQLPAEPCWLQQVHGINVVEASACNEPPIADAVFTNRSGQVCAVMTADCLPVLFCSRSGDRVAAAHAGWRGLSAGVLAATIRSLNIPPPQLLAWLGPTINRDAYEVGDEVRAAFLACNAANHPYFIFNNNQRWQADMHGLARSELQRLGVQDIFSDAACAVNDASQFFSYRRDGRTGRMASMIWLQPDYD